VHPPHGALKIEGAPVVGIAGISLVSRDRLQQRIDALEKRIAQAEWRLSHIAHSGKRAPAAVLWAFAGCVVWCFA
jgi:hypothetical protein